MRRAPSPATRCTWTPATTSWIEPAMPRLAPRPIPLLLAALLGGCANLAPDFQQPALPVPAQYATPAPDAAVPLDSDWRNYFRDPQLQALIAQALQNNRDLRIAVSRVAQARAAYGIEAS